MAATEIIPYLDTDYRYEVVPFNGGSGFEMPSFDDSGFATGDAGFGTPTGSCSLNNTTDVQTTWPLNTDILLRKDFDLPAGATDLTVSVAIDNDIQVFINGQDISGGLRVHEGCPSRDTFAFTAPDGALVTGTNLLAIRARDRGGLAYVDVRLTADIAETAVEIDVKPRSDPNVINSRGEGTIPVALHSTADLDVTTEVVRESLTFGRTGDEASLRLRRDGTAHCQERDVNHDRLTDLVCQFQTSETGFQPDSGAFPGNVRPTSYDMPNGQTGSFHYWDDSYDGNGNTSQDLAPLDGGLGDLTDGVLAADNWHVVEAPPGAGPYVGWRTVNPTIIAHFDAVTQFETVSFHFDDSGGAGDVNPPASVIVNGTAFDVAAQDPAGTEPFTVTFDISNQMTDTLVIEIVRKRWVFLSEMWFTQTPQHPGTNGGRPGVETEAILRGELADGTSIAGSDTVLILSPGEAAGRDDSIARFAVPARQDTVGSPPAEQQDGSGNVGSGLTSARGAMIRPGLTATVPGEEFGPGDEPHEDDDGFASLVDQAMPGLAPADWIIPLRL